MELFPNIIQLNLLNDASHVLFKRYMLIFGDHCRYIQKLLYFKDL